MFTRIPKIILGFLIADIIFFAGYMFFSFYDKDGIVMGRVYQNIYLIGFLYFSIIFGYTLSLHATILARNTLYGLVFVNILVWGSVFLKTTIGMSDENIILIFSLFIILILILFIKHRIRSILGVVFGLGVLILLFLNIIPTYSIPLNLQDFYSNQSLYLFSDFKSQPDNNLFNINLSIQTNEYTQVTQKKIPLQSLSEKYILPKGLSSFKTINITFPNYENLSGANLVLVIPNGVFIQISKGSEVEILNSGNKIYLNMKEGNFDLISSEDIDLGIDYFVSTGSDVYISQSSQNILQSQLNQFEIDKKDYVVKQIGGLVPTSSTLDTISREFIILLSNIYPSKYRQRLLNYQEYHKYIQVKSSTDYQKESKVNVNENIINQTKKGFENTKFIKLLDGLFTF